MKRIILFVHIALLSGFPVFSQEKSLVDTHKSPFASLWGTDMGQVTWTNGFWAERFEVCKTSMVPNIWHTYASPDISHAFRNFEIAAGQESGKHAELLAHNGLYAGLVGGIVSQEML